YASVADIRRSSVVGTPSMYTATSRTADPPVAMAPPSVDMYSALLAGTMRVWLRFGTTVKTPGEVREPELNTVARVGSPAAACAACAWHDGHLGVMPAPVTVKYRFPPTVTPARAV